MPFAGSPPSPPVRTGPAQAAWLSPDLFAKPLADPLNPGLSVLSTLSVPTSSPAAPAQALPLDPPFCQTPCRAGGSDWSWDLRAKHVNPAVSISPHVNPAVSVSPHVHLPSQEAASVFEVKLLMQEAEKFICEKRSSKCSFRAMRERGIDGNPRGFPGQRVSPLQNIYCKTSSNCTLKRALSSF